MINYAGNSASYPANVSLIAAGDAPSASNLQQASRDLADRAAFIKANASRAADVQTFTANGTWTKPADALWVDIILVGGGAAGQDGLSGQGGQGGNSGEIVFTRLRASDLAATVAVTIGAGAASGGLSGGATYLTSSGNVVAFAVGGAGTSFNPGMPPGLDSADVTSQGVNLGGAGGTGAVGARGKHSRHGGGLGGAGGATNAPGSRGLGYGAGGGGGRQSSGGVSGGGGGGGGYFANALAANGVNATAGAGAPGICIITTHRGLASA